MLRRTLIVLVATLATAAPAAAGTIVVKLTFTPGKLAVKAAPASATSAGPVQVPVTLADGRGSGAGWTLTIRAARPLDVSAVSARCAPNSTCTLPKAVQGPAGAVVLRAARGSGMGVMNLVVTVAALRAGTPPTPLTFAVS
ncbi:MAG TPA: hypothetical protein VFA05_07065 [Gaiellaceae bacterium]|nr:hypothetical protein [Gaiellaceae bacterium]